MKCKDCACYKDEWCTMVTDSPDADMERDCAHFIREQRWIPVTERLPEADRTFTHDKSVLVYVPENKKMLHHGIYEGKLVTDEIDGERVTDWLLWGWPYIDRERPFVTHWMPLPEPPEVSDH